MVRPERVSVYCASDMAACNGRALSAIRDRGGRWKWLDTGTEKLEEKEVAPPFQASYGAEGAWSQSKFPQVGTDCIDGKLLGNCKSAMALLG